MAARRSGIVVRAVACGATRPFSRWQQRPASSRQATRSITASPPSTGGRPASTAPRSRALWALGVAAEIVLFAISGRLPIAPTTLLLVGAAGAVIRWAAMAFDPPCGPAAAAAMSACALVRRVPSRRARLRRAHDTAKLGATAQGYLAVALGLVMAGVDGTVQVWLYARWGGLAYGPMALAAGTGGIFALAAHHLMGGAIRSS